MVDLEPIALLIEDSMYEYDYDEDSSETLGNKIFFFMISLNILNKH